MTNSVVAGASVVVLGSFMGAATGHAQDGAGRPLPSARKPFQVKDLQSAIAQTAAVVEGVVSNIRYEYNEEKGPWTRVTLSDVKAHVGSAPERLEIRQFGGRLPNGNMVVAAELPVFIEGRRYVVFLRNTTWNLSPVVGDLALRVEKVSGVEVLVNSDGQAVAEVSPRGVEVGAALFEGLELDGTPPQALPEKLLDFERQPLDRRSFIEALQTTLGAQSLSVSGAFSPTPAGEFKWRNQRTARSTRHAVPGDAFTNQTESALPEVDMSKPR